MGAVQESKNPISIQICEHDFVNEITPVILSLAVLAQYIIKGNQYVIK